MLHHSLAKSTCASHLAAAQVLLPCTPDSARLVLSSSPRTESEAACRCCSCNSAAEHLLDIPADSTGVNANKQHLLQSQSTIYGHQTVGMMWGGARGLTRMSTRWTLHGWKQIVRSLYTLAAVCTSCHVASYMLDKPQSQLTQLLGVSLLLRVLNCACLVLS